MIFGLDFLVVLKDGTTVKNMVSGLGSGHNEDTSFGTTYFTAPIDLEEIDYILIGDPEIDSTHKVYLP
jgi:hypothetical protein